MLDNIIEIGKVANPNGAIFKMSHTEKHIKVFLKYSEEFNSFQLDRVEIGENGTPDYYLDSGVTDYNSLRNSILPGSYIGFKAEKDESKSYRYSAKAGKNYRKDIGLNAILKVIDSSSTEKEDRSFLKEFLTNLVKAISDNQEAINHKIDSIKDDVLKTDKKAQIPVIVIIDKVDKFNKQNFTVNKIDEVFQTYLKFYISDEAIQIDENSFAPESKFYDAFSYDKPHTLYGLNKNSKTKQFRLSLDEYRAFYSGREELKNSNRFKILNTPCYITSSESGEELKVFQKELAKSLKDHDLEKFIKVLSDNKIKKKVKGFINFYFFEPTKTGTDIIEQTKDTNPTYLSDIHKSWLKINSYFGEMFKKQEKVDFEKIYWDSLISLLFKRKDDLKNNLSKKKKKIQTHLFRQIVLRQKIDSDLVFKITVDYFEAGIRGYVPNDKKNVWNIFSPIYYQIFIYWLNLLQGEEMSSELQFFTEKSVEERLEFYLQNAPTIKDDISAQSGVAVGVLVASLNGKINDFSKKKLGFASKKILRDDIESLMKFTNDISEKYVLHIGTTKKYGVTSDYLSKLGTEFNKDRFIFGLFLGNSINFKLGEDLKRSDNSNSSKGDN